MSISWKLVLSSLRHDHARLSCAVLGIAAAVALVAWHVGLAVTGIAQSAAAVEAATAPFSAWVSGPAAQVGRGAEGARSGERAHPPALRATPLKEGGNVEKKTPPSLGGDAPDASTRLPPSLRGDAPEGQGGVFRASPSSGRAHSPSRPQAESTVGFRRRASLGVPVPQTVVEEICLLDEVARVFPISASPVALDVRPGGRVLQGPPLMGVLAALPDAAGALPFANVALEGRIPAPGATNEIAVCRALFTARRLPVPALGEPLTLILRDRTATLTVVGLFDGTDLVREFPTLYVSEAAAETLLGRVMPPNLLLIETSPGADPATLAKALDAAGEAGEGCRFVTRESVRERFRSDTVANLVRSLPLSLSITFLTAVAMLATVLTIGLATHRRRIAELRCAGMTRGGVARLTALEAIVSFVPGWLLGLGAAAALLQAFLAAENSPQLPKTVHLGWQTPVVTAAFALLAGLAATLVPCLRAASVKPLEVLGADATRTRPVSVRRTLLGLALVAVLPLVGLGLDLPAKARSALMILVGLPCYTAGTILCLHALMRLTERLFLRPVGAMVRLDPRILSRRLSRDPGRALGTVLTLSLGLGGFLAVHIWGGTLMSSYVPSPTWPDVIVSALPGGLSREQFGAAARIAGFARPAAAVEASQFLIDADQAAEIAAAGGSPEGLVLVFGADPADAFGGAAPLAPFRFVEGTREEAAAALAARDACVVPEMFTRLTGLHRGDRVRLAGRSLEIVGVVDLNWHLVTSRAQVRTRSGRLGPTGTDGNQLQSTAIGSPRTRGANDTSAPAGPGARRTMGMVFVSDSLAREMTGNADRVYFFWGNLSDELRAMHPLAATVRLDAQIRAAVGDDGANSLQVHHRDEVSDGTIAHGNQILGTMARIPFWSLIVTSTGIAVLLIASARMSRHEIEALRAVGMTRGQLARMFLGEAALVTLCAILASLLGGAVFGWSFTGWTRATMNAGLPVTFAFPWGMAARGIGFAVALSALMAALPLAYITRRA